MYKMEVGSSLKWFVASTHKTFVVTEKTDSMTMDMCHPSCRKHLHLVTGKSTYSLIILCSCWMQC